MSKKCKVVALASLLAASFTSTAFAYGGHDFDRSSSLQIDHAVSCQVPDPNLYAIQCSASAKMPRNDYAY